MTRLSMSARGRKVVGLSVILVLGVFVLNWRMSREQRERHEVLQLLAATNATLSSMEETLHVRFTLWRRGTPEWEQMHSRSAAPQNSAWNHSIARKMETTATLGHTSTIDMQTYIFLDASDRLVDFEVGSQ